VNWADVIAEIRTILLADTAISPIVGTSIWIKGAEASIASPRIVIEMRGGPGRQNQKYHKGEVAIHCFASTSISAAFALAGYVQKAIEGDYTTISGFSYIARIDSQAPQQIPAGEEYGVSQGFTVLAKEVS
jgi:hypothetical protein